MIFAECRGSPLHFAFYVKLFILTGERLLYNHSVNSGLFVHFIFMKDYVVIDAGHYKNVSRFFHFFLKSEKLA